MHIISEAARRASAAERLSADEIRRLKRRENMAMMAIVLIASAAILALIASRLWA